MTAIADIFSTLQNEPRQENIDQPQEQSGTTFDRLSTMPKGDGFIKAMAPIGHWSDTAFN